MIRDLGASNKGGRETARVCTVPSWSIGSSGNFSSCICMNSA